jgi:hypothetical protein
MPPVANYTYTISSPLVVAFTDTSTNAPTSWSWNFGDGNTSTSQNPTHTYTTNGVYTVSLTATNGSGNNTYSTSVTPFIPDPRTLWYQGYLVKDMWLNGNQYIMASDGTTAASSSPTYNIFNSATPGTSQIDYTDGGGSLKVGNRFYTFATNGVKVVGLRVYNPASSTSTFLGLSVTAYAYLDDWTGARIDGITTFATTPIATKTYTATRVAGTWTDILFDTPFTLPKISSASGTNDLLTLAVQYAGGNDYIFVTPIRAGGNSPYESDMILGTYWSEDGFVGRAVNTLTNNSINADYGLDMLFQSIP